MGRGRRFRFIFSFIHYLAHEFGELAEVSFGIERRFLRWLVLYGISPLFHPVIIAPGAEVVEDLWKTLSHRIRLSNV